MHVTVTSFNVYYDVLDAESTTMIFSVVAVFFLFKT